MVPQSSSSIETDEGAEVPLPNAIAAVRLVAMSSAGACDGGFC